MQTGGRKLTPMCGRSCRVCTWHVQIWGSELDPHFVSERVCLHGTRVSFWRFMFLTLKAGAAWQWSNFYHALLAKSAPRKRALRLNLDETSIPCYEGNARGCVFGSRKRPSSVVCQHLPKSKRRKTLTHVAVICDVPEIQAVLPHFVIGNEHSFLQRDVEALRAACGPNIILIRLARGLYRLIVCFDL